MSSRGQIQTWRLQPSNRPTATVEDKSVFVSGTNLLFSMVSQSIDALSFSVSGLYGVYRADTNQFVPITSFGFNPQCGSYNLFGQWQIKQYGSPLVYDSVLNSGQKAQIFTQAQHPAGTFLDHCGGTFVYPGLIDTSARSSLAACPFVPAGQTVENHNFLLSEFHHTPLSGLLNGSKALNMSLTGGLDLWATVGHFYEVFQSTFTVGGVKLGDQWVITPANDTTGVINPWSPGEMIGIDTSQYRIAIADPVLWVVYRVADSDPSISSILYPNVTVNPVPMNVDKNFRQAYMLNDELVRSMYFTVADRDRVYQDVFGPFTTLSMCVKDTSLLANNTRQFYAFPTSIVNPKANNSEVMPDELCLTPLLTAGHNSNFQETYLGGSITYNYDESGNGMTMENVILSFSWLTMNYPNALWPFNAPGTDKTTSFGFNLYRQYNLDLPVNAQDLTDYGLGTAGSYDKLLQTVMNPVMKFYTYKNASPSLEVRLTLSTTETAVVNKEASIVTSTTQKAKNVPRELHLRSAPGVSTIVREVKTRLLAQKISNPPQNTLMYQIQKPDTGLEGRSFLYFRMDYGATLPQYPVTVQAHGFTSQFLNTDVPNALTYQEAYAAPPQAFGLTSTNAYGWSRVLLVTSSTVTDAGLNPHNWANACAYLRGPTAFGGDSRYIRGYEIILPDGVTLQRPDVQRINYLQRFGNGFDDTLRERAYLSGQSYGLVDDGSSDSYLSDVFKNRDNGTKFSSYHSSYCISHKTKSNLSDFPLAAPFRNCIAVHELDEVLRKMQGVSNKTSARRLYNFMLDLRPGAQADLGAITCLPTSIYLSSWADMTTLATPFHNSVTYNLPKPRLWSVVDDEVYMCNNQIFHDAVTQNKIDQDFVLNGVTLDVHDFYFMRHFLEQDPATLSVTLDQLTKEQPISISGYNPRVIHVSHYFATDNSGDLNTYNDMAYGDDQLASFMLLPQYITAKHGCFAYSTVGGINSTATRANKLSSIRSLELEVLIDSSTINNGLYNYGSTPADRVNYAIAYGAFQAIPEWDTTVAADRRCVTWTPLLSDALSSTYRGLLDTPSQYAAYTGNPLLPLNKVVTCYVPDSYQNGALLQVNNVGSIGVNALGKGMVTSAGSATQWEAWHQPRYFCREYAFPQSYSVTFNASSASRKYHYPLQNAM